MTSLPSPSSPSPPATFETRGLTKHYATGEVVVEALRGVDLELWAGETVVLLARIFHEAG